MAKNYRTIDDWELERENIQAYLDSGLTHREIGYKYGVSRSNIDTIIKRLGISSNYTKFGFNNDNVMNPNLKKKINTTISEELTLSNCTDLVPYNYSLPLIFKINILKYRADRNKYSTVWSYYIPEIGKWVTGTTEFKNRLKHLNITYDEWECKWILKLPIEKLYSEDWINRVVLYRYGDRPENTRNYIKQKFKEDHNYVCNFFITRDDLVYLYEESRKESLYKINYDFSQVPYLIKSPRENFTLLVNESGDIKEYNGKYITNYFVLVKEKKDIKSLMGNKLSVIRSQGKDLFEQKCKLVHGDIFDFRKVVYINNRTPVILINKITGYEFESTPDRILQGYGDPTSNETTGEKLVREFLKEYLGINQPKSQVVIKDVIVGRNSNKVIIDFIIEYNEIEIWIEYNGIQHYEEVKYFYLHGRYSLSDQLQRDQNVRNYCKDNNILLIEIPYTLNTYEKIKEFLDKVILQGIDPNTLIDYKSLYKN